MVFYYIFVDGYGFTDEHVLTVVDQVNGNKVGWPLGAMIFEINALPSAIQVPVVSLGVSYADDLLSLFIGTICICFNLTIIFRRLPLRRAFLLSLPKV